MPALAFTSPVGPLAIFEFDGAIVALDWGWPPESEETTLLVRARDQLEAYFARELKVFDLPLAPSGTPFQRKVWEALSRIPFGSVRTYGELAAELNTAPRALGGACGRNPIPVIVPCHRVLAANRAMGGYSGMDGIETKRVLLELEGAL